MPLGAVGGVRRTLSTAEITSSTLAAGSAAIAAGKQLFCNSSARTSTVVACGWSGTGRVDAVGRPTLDELDSVFGRVDRERECVLGPYAGGDRIRQRNLLRIQGSQRSRCCHEHHGNGFHRQVVKLANACYAPADPGDSETATMAYRNVSNGIQHTDSFAFNKTKTVKNITYLSNSNVGVLPTTLVP
jgi:hypothetical protein